MIQAAYFEHVGVIKNEDVYTLPNREAGNHGGAYVEKEHVDDALVALNDVLELLRRSTMWSGGHISAAEVAATLVNKAIDVAEKAIEKLK